MSRLYAGAFYAVLFADRADGCAEVFDDLGQIKGFVIRCRAVEEKCIQPAGARLFGAGTFVLHGGIVTL